MIGQTKGDLGGFLAGLLVDAQTFDGEDLSDVREVQVVVQRRGGPNRTRLQTPVRERNRFAEIRRTAAFEEQADVGQQSRLIGFDREQVMGTAFFDQVAGELALGEQGIGGDRRAADVHAREQRDDHPDLIGLFDLVGAVYRQRGDFFWV